MPSGITSENTRESGENRISGLLLNRRFDILVTF